MKCFCSNEPILFIFIKIDYNKLEVNMQQGFSIRTAEKLFYGLMSKSASRQIAKLVKPETKWRILGCILRKLQTSF